MRKVGAAPTDIQYDGNGNLYVLMNHLNASGLVQTEILNYDLLGNNLWISQPYLSSSVGHWSSELIVNTAGLTTFPYDLSSKIPGAVTFNTSGTIINATSYTADGESRIYGIYEDPLNGDIYGAGYILGEDSDTNAYVIKTNSSLVQQTSETYGITGTEKFRDIVITGDGFIAAGVRDNKGEGGYDCYIEHLDPQLLSIYKETFGGKTNERLGALMINDLGSQAWFAGYNKEYTVSGSGNAYIGGVSTQVSSSMVSCESPRVLLVDELVGSSVNTLINLNASASVISTCNTHNIKNVLLYDIDRIYDPLSVANATTKQAVDHFLDDLLQAGIRIGLIVGPDIAKLRALTDIMKGVTVNSMNFHGKINYIMVEHEFWNPTASGAPTVLNNSQYGANWSSATTYNNSVSKSKYFWHLSKDHMQLLTEIENQLGLNHNWWSSLDYIGHLRNLDATSQTYYDFNGTNINSLTAITGASPALILQSHREGLAEKFISKSDYTFLVYYRDASAPFHFMGTNNITGEPNFDLVNTSSNFSKRLEAYRNKASFAKGGTNEFYHLPLFSNESTTNSCGIENWLGDWLGGTNTYRKVELAYTGQFNACASCANNTVLGVFGWFKYTCISSHGSFTGAQAYDLVSCTAGGQIGINESLLVDQVIVYPNPAKDFIQLTLPSSGINASSQVEYTVYSVSGEMVLKGNLSSDRIINVGSLDNGLYLVKILMGDTEKISKLIIE